GVARTDFLKVLIFTGLVCLIVVISTFSPYLGVSALAFLLVGLILGINLRWSILGLIFLLPFDPQIELKPGFYLYFDLFYLLPALLYFWRVLFERYRIHWASLALGPYLLFAVLTSFWRAENLFWFSAYSVRLAIAILFASVVSCICRA